MNSKYDSKVGLLFSQLKNGRNFGIYLFSSIAVKGIHYLSTPIFTRLMSKEEFGIVSMFATWTVIFSIFISLQIAGTVPSAFIKYKEKIKDYLSSTLLLSLIPFFTISLVLLFFRNKFTALLQLKSAFLIPMLLVCAYGMSLVNMVSQYTIQLKKPKINSIVSVSVAFLLLLTGSALAYIFTANKYIGKALGETVIYGLVIIGVFYFFNINKGRYSKEYWPLEMALGIPLIVHLLATKVISQSDRLLITALIGYEANAVFSVAAAIGMVAVIVVEAFTNVWTPWFFGELNKEKVDKIKIQRIYSFAVVFISLLHALIIITCPLLFRIMAPSSYIGGISCSMFITMAGLFNFFYRIPLSYEQYRGNLRWVALATISASVCNLIFNYFLIKIWGINGAAIATVFSTFLLWTIHEYVVRRIIKEYPLSITINFFGVAIVFITALVAWFFESVAIKIAFACSIMMLCCYYSLKIYSKGSIQ